MTDKKILKKQIWELESEKEDENFKQCGVQRKAKDLQQKVEIFEKQQSSKPQVIWKSMSLRIDCLLMKCFMKSPSQA